MATILEATHYYLFFLFFMYSKSPYSLENLENVLIYRNIRRIYLFLQKIFCFWKKWNSKY